MPNRRSSLGSERGETLVELIVSVAILGVAAVAVLAGLMFSVKSSVMHRNDATGGAYVRSFAEAIQTYVDTNGYQPCLTAASTYAGVAVPDLPSGFTKSVSSVQSWTWNTSTQTGGWGVCTGKGIQRLDLTVTTTGDSVHRADETLTVVLRQPCNGSAATAGATPCA